MAGALVGSPVFGAIAGLIIGTLNSATTGEFGATEYTLTLDKDVGTVCTALGWLLGAAYEAFYENNGIAALVLVPLAVFVVFLGFAAA